MLGSLELFGDDFEIDCFFDSIEWLLVKNSMQTVCLGAPLCEPAVVCPVDLSQRSILFESYPRENILRALLVEHKTVL